MTRYFDNSTLLAEYAAGVLHDLRPDSLLTMTIKRDKSGGCYALTAIGMSSEDTETPKSSKRPTSTYLRELGYESQ